MKTPEASYRVSYRTALAGKAHTVRETLIKPCAVEMVTGVLGEQSTEKVEIVQLSNNTVEGLIGDFMFRWLCILIYSFKENSTWC
jgi:hypothetical protein